ncbi:VCBS repeat-containing protein [candidate division KSB1 bacterium]|nr:VCBS repeat-containing protein [candidate division KSB1 bacterium]
MLGNLFDADRDGDLDLFIACQYRSNAFFLNNGCGQFTEVTQAAGLQTEGGGIGGFVADFDGDGWEDLYVTRVNRPNLLYRNLGVDDSTGMPRFADASAESGGACWPELKQSQGAALADYDNDGDCDIFVCNLETGNRLLENDGKGRFTDVTAEAGLAAHDQSFGATFFDADNDGDLDLVVANRGRDRFYKNLEGRSFLEHSEYLGGNFLERNLLMFPSRQFGGSSHGTLAFDYEEDEDLDVLISSFDDGLFFFRNGLRVPNSAVQIFPEGIVSNRSAVGAKVFLYKAGGLSDAAALVGSRSIESASSYGCSPAKVAHFGVDPQAQYDAKIVFPSGTVREVRGMRGGDRLVVRELEGWAAEAIKARRTLVDLFMGYRSRERYVLFAFGALSLSLLLYAGKRIVGLSQRDLSKLTLLYGASLLSVFLYWFAKTETAFVLRPLVLSAAVTILAILLMRTQRLYRGRVASMDMLHARLNAFDHGSLIRQLMDRLVFFAENLEPEAKLSDETRRRLLEATSGVTHFLKNEIEAIRAYQDSNNFAMELAYRLDDTWSLLKRVLKRLQASLVQEESFDHGALRAAANLQGQMRELVADFKRRADQHYRAEICAVIQDYLRKLEHDSITLNLPEALPSARILPADLAYVLDELVQNALRHIEGRRPNVVIQARHALDEIHLDVRDNGCGIPEHLWEQVFRPGFTTKRNAPGGFGLYHARQRLEKYGAKIFVAESTSGEGTIMRICLRAAEV